jgi:hypothetical protein
MRSLWYALDPSSIKGKAAIVGLFRWFESKTVLGEVIKDYGDIGESVMGLVGGRVRVSAVLCRQRGQLRLVFRSKATAPLTFSIEYSVIDATPDSLAALSHIVEDAQRELEINPNP